jgi:hypothetical protein
VACNSPLRNPITGKSEREFNNRPIDMQMLWMPGILVDTLLPINKLSKLVCVLEFIAWQRHFEQTPFARLEVVHAATCRIQYRTGWAMITSFFQQCQGCQTPFYLRYNFFSLVTSTGKLKTYTVCDHYEIVSKTGSRNCRANTPMHTVMLHPCSTDICMARCERYSTQV